MTLSTPAWRREAGGWSPQAVWGRWTLLCLSSRGCRPVDSFEYPIDPAGKVALEAASNLFCRAPYSSPSVNVGSRLRVVSHSGGDGHVGGALESSVALSIQWMTCCIS